METKLTLETFNAISALKHVITEERFKTVTKGQTPQNYTEEYGQKVVAHLAKLEAYYVHYKNIFNSRLEILSPIKPVITQDLIGDIVPHLIDVRSLELQPKPIE